MLLFYSTIGPSLNAIYSFLLTYTGEFKVNTNIDMPYAAIQSFPSNEGLLHSPLKKIWKKVHPNLPNLLWL